MKNLLILLVAACIMLMGCGEKTADERRAEQSAKERAVKNRAGHDN